jgi:hypothetical protein
MDRQTEMPKHAITSDRFGLVADSVEKFRGGEDRGQERPAGGEDDGS